MGNFASNVYNYFAGEASERTDSAGASTNRSAYYNTNHNYEKQMNTYYAASREDSAANSFSNYNTYDKSIAKRQESTSCAAALRIGNQDRSYRIYKSQIRSINNKVTKQQSQQFYNNLRTECSDFDWDPMLDKEVKYVELEHMWEYNFIERLFYKTGKRKQHYVTNIFRVQNLYLMGRYMLKKLEMQNLYETPEEQLLFHGTLRCNLNSICTDNFNWRKSGQALGHRFGRGISFTPISYYASHYCDKNVPNKVMFVAKVIISEICTGRNNMILPDYCDTGLRCDTSEKEDGSVLVKYYDDEFYPAYIICFTERDV